MCFDTGMTSVLKKCGSALIRAFVGQMPVPTGVLTESSDPRASVTHRFRFIRLFRFNFHFPSRYIAYAFFDVAWCRSSSFLHIKASLTRECLTVLCPVVESALLPVLARDPSLLPDRRTQSQTWLTNLKRERGMALIQTLSQTRKNPLRSTRQNTSIVICASSMLALSWPLDTLGTPTLHPKNLAVSDDGLTGICYPCYV